MFASQNPTPRGVFLSNRISGVQGILAGAETGREIRTIQELSGYKHLETTMIYTHAVWKKPPEVRSPLDGL